MAMLGAVARSGPAGRVTVAAFAIGVGAASTAVVRANAGMPTSYAASATSAAVVDVLAGIGLLGVGAVLLATGRAGVIGPLAVAAGVAWFAADWVGWADGSDLVRSLAMLLTPLLLPVVAHLGIAAPEGRFTSRRQRIAVVLLDICTVVVIAGIVGWRDPFLDPNCWRVCDHNPLVVNGNPAISRALDTAWIVTAVVAGTALAAWMIVRLVLSSPVGRRSGFAVWIPVAAYGIAEATYAFALGRNRAEDPADRTFLAIYNGRGVALVALSAGLMWTAARDRQTHRAVGRLAEQLGAAPMPGPLGAVLARTLGDPGLEVAYWLPASERYVDTSGQPADLRPSARRMVTPIVRNGGPVALVAYDRSLIAGRDFADEVGAAARLAVDNERLRAEVLSQLDALRTSQARIVERADATRRQLERDLHDGAQQRLLALHYELRLAERDAVAVDDAKLADAFAQASAETNFVLDDLRQLAVGIYPAALSTSGLATALRGLAEQALLPVELSIELPVRPAGPVENTAYVIVAELVAGAVQRDATFTTVRLGVASAGNAVTIEVDDDGKGPPAADVIMRVTDRIGAHGGTLRVVERAVTMELPCGS